MRWLLHVMGIDTQQSYYYDFWSGIATQFSVVVGVVTYYRKANCHRPWCFRVGKHAPDGTPWCTKHHPAND